MKDAWCKDGAIFLSLLRVDSSSCFAREEWESNGRIEFTRQAGLLKSDVKLISEMLLLIAKQIGNSWKFEEVTSIVLDLKEKRRFLSMSSATEQDKSVAKNTNLSFWLERWQADQIGFHRPDVSEWVKHVFLHSCHWRRCFPFKTIQQVPSRETGFLWATAMRRLPSLWKDAGDESCLRCWPSCCWPWRFAESSRSILSRESARLWNGNRRE